jgi:hypothetical protein
MWHRRRHSDDFSVWPSSNSIAMKGLERGVGMRRPGNRLPFGEGLKRLCIAAT